MQDTDRNYLSYADVKDVRLVSDVIDPALDGESRTAYDDILKLSHATNFEGIGLTVCGGSENAVDMNRMCSNVLLDTCQIFGGEQCGMVIKGGSSNIKLRDVTFHDCTGAYDIEIGGWSDQSQAPTTDVTLDHVWREDGHPVRVVLGNADRPRIIGGNVKILFWRSLALKGYILVKRYCKWL